MIISQDRLYNWYQFTLTILHCAHGWSKKCTLRQSERHERDYPKLRTPKGMERILFWCWIRSVCCQLANTIDAPAIKQSSLIVYTPTPGKTASASRITSITKAFRLVCLDSLRRIRHFMTARMKPARSVYASIGGLGRSSRDNPHKG